MNIYEGTPATNFLELSPEQLYRDCDPELLPFETTADAEELTRFIGQPRALEHCVLGSASSGTATTFLH